MKKILAGLALSLALLTVPAAAFSDVDEGLYYAAPIAWAVEQGITTGITETTFSPDKLCTRGQIITFLWRAAGSPSPENGDSPYTDVTELAMKPDFYKAILWASQAGITAREHQFHPNAPCDRGTTMYFLWRYAGSPNTSAPGDFTDVSPDADYARAVAWAVEAGITDGTAETTFSPDEPCTRGQIATFLYRCMNYKTPEPVEVEVPVEPETPPTPEPVAETHPQWTRSGTGEARSLGLDGSDFTSEELYTAEASINVYSPYEAEFTLKVPFPLFQACSYAVRFTNPDQTGDDYLFICRRWDEAFADMIPWDGDHQIYIFTDLSGKKQDAFFTAALVDEARTDGVISWRICFERNSSFTFDQLEGYEFSCAVNSNL